MKKEDRLTSYEHNIRTKSLLVGTMTMALATGLSVYAGVSLCDDLGLIDLGTQAVNTVVNNSEVQTVANAVGLGVSGIFTAFFGTCAGYGAKKTLSEYKAYRKAKKEEEMDR